MLSNDETIDLYALVGQIEEELNTAMDARLRGLRRSLTTKDPVRVSRAIRRFSYPLAEAGKHLRSMECVIARRQLTLPLPSPEKPQKAFEFKNIHLVEGGS